MEFQALRRSQTNPLHRTPEKSKADSGFQQSNVYGSNTDTGTVNPVLMKRLAERQQNALMIEILSSGERKYVEMSLRDLLAYINKEASSIDAAMKKHSSAG